MDDTYLWSHDRDHLQRTLAELEVRLARDGLYIHPAKTAILYSEPTGGGDFRIGAATVPCQPFGTVITALGSPLAPQPGRPLALQAPVRAHAHHHGQECGPMGGAGLARPVTDTLLKAINSTQLRQIRTMLGGGRPPEKAWVDWNQRTLRRARVLLHQAGEPRWSTFLLGQMWDMARSREGGPTCSAGRT